MVSFSVELLEAGALTLALAAFLKDINGVGKTGVVNPGHLFGQVRRGPKAKNVTQSLYSWLISLGVFYGDVYFNIHVRVHDERKEKEDC